MKFYLLAFTCFVSLLAGCSEYELSKFVERAPEIQVDPLDHNYGHLAAGNETQEITVNVWNVGNDTLDIERIFLNLSLIGGNKRKQNKDRHLEW